MDPQSREDLVINTYQSHGAKLVEAHGVLTGTTSIVPDDTIIMFLSEPGYCMLISAGRRVARDFFESRRGLMQFFKSGNQRRNYKHVSDILKRTHVPGEKYLDLTLEMFDKTSKSYGYIKKLPLTTRPLVSAHHFASESAPKFAETAGPLVYKKQVKLSSIIKQTGPGVYIVSACRVSPYERGPQELLPTNTPHISSWPYVPFTPSKKKGTIANVIKSVPTGKSKPTKKKLVLKNPKTRNYDIMYEMGLLQKKGATINTVLNHMYRENPIHLKDLLRVPKKTVDPATTNAIRKYIAPLPANTNVTKLKYTLGVLQNKNTIKTVFNQLKTRDKLLFLSQPSKRAKLIYGVFT